MTKVSSGSFEPFPERGAISWYWQSMLARKQGRSLTPLGRINTILADATATLERLDLAHALNDARVPSETEALRDALIGSVSHQLKLRTFPRRISRRPYAPFCKVHVRFM
jgi:hypothetical protein